VGPSILEYTFTTDAVAGTTLVAGQSYHITVSAVSLVGEGEQSNPLTIWAIDLPAAPPLSLIDTSRESCTV